MFPIRVSHVLRALRSRVVATIILSFLAAAAPCAADNEDQSVLLRYKLKAGEVLPYQVTHVAKTKTTVRGTEQVTNVHTISRRHWEVVEVKTNGDMVFAHVIDRVEMTQDDGENETRWDSEGAEDPPAAFRAVAERIGKRLSTITINQRGQEVGRDNNQGSKSSLGMGSITLTFPEQHLEIGGQWSMPREIKARNEDGTVKSIKIRERYTLTDLANGVATFRVESQPLTPINKESVRAQVLQQLSNGTIRFDVDNGRLLEKQLDWDENVVGFQGPTTAMEYRARMTEEFIDEPIRTASKP